MTMKLAELEGLLRQGGKRISQPDDHGVEEVVIPGGEDEPEEKFVITTTNERKVRGTITMWNTRTGDDHEVDLNAVQRDLKLLHTDPTFPEFLGKPLFTLDVKSAPKKELGTLLCPLNPKHPDWLTYKALGAQPCRKATLPHELAVESHLRIKHQATWKNLERKRVLQLEEEERQFRRFQMGLDPFTGLPRNAADRATTAASAASVTLPIPASVIATAATTMTPIMPLEPAEAAAKPLYVKACEDCGAEFTSVLPLAASQKLAGHKRREHPAT